MKRLLTGLVCCLMFVSMTLSADWPQWRGPNRDGVSTEVGLLEQWPDEGPPLRWKASDIGTGYSSPSIAGGRVYLQTTREDEEFALALREQTGELIWRVPIGRVGQNRGPQYPGTRSTPTVDGDLIYCLASDGELVCLEAASGESKWQRHLKKDFDGQPGNWAYAESVLIDAEVLVCTPGGSAATLATLNKKTGEVIWKSAVPDGDNAEYASIMVVDDGKRKQYVQFLRKGIVGVDANTGDFLWRYDATADQGANIFTPVVQGNRVFSAGSRSGGALVELEIDGNRVTPKEIYFQRELGASIGGAVLVKGYLYGATSKAMFCVEFETGEIMWLERAVGAASICFADDRLYVRAHDSGDVFLVEPSPEGYQEKGRFSQPQRSDSRAWPHPVVANGRLYLRDEGVLLCYDITAARENPSD